MDIVDDAFRVGTGRDEGTLEEVELVRDLGALLGKHE